MVCKHLLGIAMVPLNYNFISTGMDTRIKCQNLATLEIISTGWVMEFWDLAFPQDVTLDLHAWEMLLYIWVCLMQV